MDEPPGVRLGHRVAFSQDGECPCVVRYLIYFKPYVLSKTHIKYLGIQNHTNVATPYTAYIHLFFIHIKREEMKVFSSRRLSLSPVHCMLLASSKEEKQGSRAAGWERATRHPGLDGVAAVDIGQTGEGSILNRSIRCLAKVSVPRRREKGLAMVGGSRMLLWQAGESLAFQEQEGTQQVKKNRGHISDYGSPVECRVPISGPTV